jgi:hypothetical protein
VQKTHRFVRPFGSELDDAPATDFATADRARNGRSCAEHHERHLGLKNGQMVMLRPTSDHLRALRGSLAAQRWIGACGIVRMRYVLRRDPPTRRR